MMAPSIVVQHDLGKSFQGPGRRLDRLSVKSFSLYGRVIPPGNVPGVVGWAMGPTVAERVDDVYVETICYSISV